LTQNGTQNATIEDRFAQFGQVQSAPQDGALVGGRLFEWFQDPVFWAAILTIFFLVGAIIAGTWFLIYYFKAPSRLHILRWNAGSAGCIPMRRKPGDLTYTNAQGEEAMAILADGHGRQSKRGWHYVIDDTTGKSMNIHPPGYERELDYADGRDVAAMAEDAVIAGTALNRTEPRGFAAVLEKHVGVMVLVGGGLGLALLVAILITINGVAA
jgi:hypothetical protein